jgi:hypothetical protein
MSVAKRSQLAEIMTAAKSKALVEDKTGSIYDIWVLQCVFISGNASL